MFVQTSSLSCLFMNIDFFSFQGAEHEAYLRRVDLMGNDDLSFGLPEAFGGMALLKKKKNNALQEQNT